VSVRESASSSGVDAWLADADAVASDLQTEVASGLTTAEASARLARIGPNRLDPEPPVPAWRKLLAQFVDPLVFLLLAAVAISLVIWIVDGAEGIPFEAVVIGVILVANAVLGFVQEARAEQAVASLQRMAAATCSVVRDGVEARVPAEDVVPGDVLLLAEGDAVSADARLVDVVSLHVAEAALTGESEPVLKDAATLTGDVALGDRLNMVFSGTAVTRGRARAIVTRTGMATEMGHIAGLLERTEEEPTPLQREIDRVAKWLGVAVLVIALVVVATIVLTSDVDDASDVVDVLLVGVSLAVAAVPEGLPAVLSVVLAVGVQRMARRNAIVKEPSSVETLGSTSVVCTDKTGTLTRNEMTIQRIVTSSGAVDVTGSGYEPEGELLVDGHPLEDDALTEEMRVVLSGGSLASNASLHEEGGAWIVHGDPTDAAFLVAEHKAGFARARRDRFRRVGEIPFTSERRLMSSLEADALGDGHFDVVTKGAPDVLLARCTHERVGSEARSLDDHARSRILATVDLLADQAFRTLAVAYRPLPGAPPEDVDEDIERELIFAGVVGIIDPPRAEARDAIVEAHRAGIRVIMITGDHPRTAGRIAADLGIVETGGRTVAGVELDRLDDAALRDTVREASVYARVAPEHKLRIVHALQEDDNVVAMTGDGVNDAPALKRADIGIAMGVTGTDVTKEAGNMVLADDNFATIVAAVREGRGIFANIRGFLRYLLSSNAGEVLTMFFGVLFAGAIGIADVGGAIAVPLLATQILWINMLTDAAPALAMGFDPPPDDVMSRPPRRLSERVIDTEMQVGVLFIGLWMALATLLTLDIGLPGGLVDGSHGLAEARTMAFTTLVLAQLFNCFNARSARTTAFHHLFTNRALWGAIALSLLLQLAVVYLPLLNDAFDTSALGATDWLVCVGTASTVLWVEELRKLAARQMRARGRQRGWAR
jgi:potassium/sodium efflux P-type ATPase